MYDNYSFVLYFGEMPEEFQEQKIDECLEKQWFSEQDGISEKEAEESDWSNISEYLADADNRSRVRKCIEAHFPLYF